MVDRLAKHWEAIERQRAAAQVEPVVAAPPSVLRIFDADGRRLGIATLPACNPASSGVVQYPTFELIFTRRGIPATWCLTVGHKLIDAGEIGPGKIIDLHYGGVIDAGCVLTVEALRVRWRIDT